MYTHKNLLVLCRNGNPLSFIRLLVYRYLLILIHFQQFLTHIFVLKSHLKVIRLDTLIDIQITNLRITFFSNGYFKCHNDNIILL